MVVRLDNDRRRSLLDYFASGQRPCRVVLDDVAPFNFALGHIAPDEEWIRDIQVYVGVEPVKYISRCNISVGSISWAECDIDYKYRQGEIVRPLRVITFYENANQSRVIRELHFRDQQWQEQSRALAASVLPPLEPATTR